MKVAYQAPPTLYRTYKFSTALAKMLGGPKGSNSKSSFQTHIQAELRAGALHLEGLAALASRCWTGLVARKLVKQQSYYTMRVKVGCLRADCC